MTVSTIVPVPVPVAIVDPPGLDRTTVKARFGFAEVSGRIGTAIVPVVLPAGIVRVPEIAL